MMRVELFVLLGAGPGFILGWLASSAWRRFLAFRDKRAEEKAIRMRVDETLDRAGTDELLNELSTRDDVGSAKKGSGR